MEKRFQVHVPYPVLAEKLDFLITEGINPEIYMDAKSLEAASPNELTEIRERLAGHGLRITMHGPYSSLNPGSRDEDVRLATVETYRMAFRAASFLKPVNIVLHAGYSEKKYKGDADLWLAQSMKTWPEFVSRAAEIGTRIAAENIFEKKPDTLRTIAEEISSPAFGLCLDTGHLNAFAKGDMEEWLSALGPYLYEVHLHDNHGAEDDHLPLGEGSIDFPLFLSLLEKFAEGPVYTIEPHGEEMMRRGIAAIRKYLGAE